LRAALRNYECNRYFVPFVGRHSYRTNIGNSGLLADDSFDLRGIDVLAAPDDEIILAVEQEDVPARIHITDVARVQPPAGERLLCRFVILPIALHDSVAAHTDLAHLTHRHRVAVIIHNDYLRAGDHPPRWQRGIGDVRNAGWPRLVRGAQRDRTASLGDAIHTAKPARKFAQRLLQKILGHGASAMHDFAQRREVGSIKSLGRQHEADHGRHEKCARGAQARHIGEEPLRGEVPLNGKVAAGREECQPDDRATVKQRARIEHDVLR